MGDTMLVHGIVELQVHAVRNITGRHFGRPELKRGRILLQLASEQLNIAPERLVVKNGEVSDRMNEASSVTFAELVKGKHIDRHISGVPIKSVSEHTISGTPTMRMDARLKVTGEAKFTGDITLPGMLHAKVLRPPSMMPHWHQLISPEQRASLVRLSFRKMV